MNLRSISVLICFCFLQVSNVNPQLMCQSNDKPQIVDFVVGENLPFIAPLNRALPKDSALTIEASVPKGAKEFSFDLLAPDDRCFKEAARMALSLRASLGQLEILEDTFEDPRYVIWEPAFPFPIQQGGNFNFTLTSSDRSFTVWVNGQFYWVFTHRVLPTEISHLRVTGDVSLTRFTVRLAEEGHCRPRADLTAQALKLKGAAPYVAELEHPFSTDSSIRVTGTFHYSGTWIAIYLQSDEIEEVIVLKFFMVQWEKAVIQNTYINGNWGWEYRNESLPIKPGDDFDLLFHCEDRHIKVCLNGNVFSRYEHRLNPERVTKVFVNGQLTLKSVIHYTNGTTNTAPAESMRSCSPLTATAGFKHILCELCTALPDPDLSVITPSHLKRNVQYP